jgi:hypothetical protein
MVLSKTNKNEDIFYSTEEICPICGSYQSDGNVCNMCLKQYNLYKPKQLCVDFI